MKQGNRNEVVGAFSRMMDYLSGTNRVDNAANPASAYSMARRKEANTDTREVQDRKIDAERMGKTLNKAQAEVKETFKPIKAPVLKEQKPKPVKPTGVVKPPKL